MTIAQIESLYTEAIAALDAGDFDTAIRKAQAVKLRLATTPNLARSLGGGNQSLAWAGPQAIDSFIADCRKAKAQALAESSGGIQQTKVTYVRPTPTDDF